MYRKGKCLGDYSSPIEKETYPKLIWQGFIDNDYLCGNVRVVEVKENTFKFEREDGKDAMGVEVWIPLDDRHYKIIAEFFLFYLLNHTENAETPINE